MDYQNEEMCRMIFLHHPRHQQASQGINQIPRSQYIASPEDEYHMPMVDLLVDGEAKPKVLSLK